MRVLQWNTHHGGMPSDGSKLNIQAITATIVKLNPDIIFLEELEQNDGYGNVDQLELHRNALQNAQGTLWYASFCQLNGGSKSLGIGVAILSKEPHLSVGRKDLGGRPGLHVFQQGSGTVLAVTHPDPSSPNKRNAELAKFLIELDRTIALKVIVGGDFNAVPTSVEMAPWPILYKDAWTEAIKLGTATSFIANGITHGSHRIDYIWSLGWRTSSCSVPDTSINGVFPSDHHPVVATFI